MPKEKKRKSANIRIEKDPERARVLLQSLARNVSTLATAKTIMGDMQVNEASITNKTLSSYLNAFGRLYVIEDVPAWEPSLRSMTAIRTSHKRQFVDPSIATAALRANAKGILRDFIIKLQDGRWAPIEVKLGNKQIEEAAANLIKLSNKVDAEKMNQPSFLMVLTGGQVATFLPFIEITSPQDSSVFIYGSEDLITIEASDSDG